MNAGTLHAEAKECLVYIHAKFTQAMEGRPVKYPLDELRACRAFAEAVHGTLASIRSPSSRLPPTALILAMIRVCDDIVDPSPEAFHSGHVERAIPRAFAYEMLDRLQAEIPATAEFALDQVGRIITEAGTQQDVTRLRHALLMHRLRMEGAFGLDELEETMASIWRRRFPETLELLEEVVASAAAAAA